MSNDWVGWTIGSIGAAAGIVAAIWAILGWRKASEANATATEALKLSRSADARATELDDVDWGYRWTEDGCLNIFNRGDSAAEEVDIRIIVDDGVGIRCTPGQVLAHGQVYLEVPAYQEVLNKRREPSVAEPKLRGWKDVVGAQYGRVGVDTHRLYVRIAWRSEAGKPHLYQKMHSPAMLSPGLI